MDYYRINGPFAALVAYLSEFHCAKHRARIQMILGIVYSSGTVVLPLIASEILSLDLNVMVFNMGKFFKSWRQTRDAKEMGGAMRKRRVSASNL